MADFITLPDDIIDLIAEHLTAQELVIFKMVCQKFNHIGSHSVFLQPLYNRLYKLDSSLPPVLNPENAVLQFKHAFEKISTRQKEEIAFLNEQHKNYDNYREQLVKLDSSNQTISHLEQQHVLLDNANASIINACIDLAKSTNSTKLDLNKVGITRFFIPEHHNDFLKILQTLILDNNLLTTIHLKDFNALQSLYFHENAPSLRVNLENCVALNTIHFLHDALVDLNIKGASNTIQFLFFEKETKLLFKQLSEATPEQEERFIARLGDRFSVQNCIHYKCASHHIGRVLKDSAYSMVNTVTNHYFPMFTEVVTEGLHKRKREDNEGEIDLSVKKHKPDNHS